MKNGETELGEHLPLLGGQSAAESRRVTYTAISFCQSLLASGTVYGRRIVRIYLIHSNDKDGLHWYSSCERREYTPNIVLKIPAQ